MDSFLTATLTPVFLIVKIISAKLTIKKQHTMQNSYKMIIIIQQANKSPGIPL